MEKSLIDRFDELADCFKECCYRMKNGDSLKKSKENALYIELLEEGKVIVDEYLPVFAALMGIDTDRGGSLTKL